MSKVQSFLNRSFYHLEIGEGPKGRPILLCGYVFRDLNEEGYWQDEFNVSVSISHWTLTKSTKFWQTYQVCEACLTHPDNILHVLGDLP